MVFLEVSLRLIALTASLTFSNLLGCKAQDVNSSASGLTAADDDASVRRILEVIPSSRTAGKFGPDSITIGNYTVLGCSSRSVGTTAGSNADYLTIYLPAFFSRMRYVLADAELGLSSFHGYNNFFKEESSKVAVAEVYRDIREGSLIELISRRGKKIERPKIVCLGEEEDESHVTGIGNLYEFFCTGTYAEHAPAAQFRKTELVVLCPSFFKLDTWPAIAWCPRTVNGVSQPDGNGLLQSQYAILIRALAGLYISASRQSLAPTLPDTPANLTVVSKLPGSVALGVRDSYAYYAAC